MLLVISAGAIPVCAECSIGKLHTNITGAGASFFLFFLFVAQHVAIQCFDLHNLKCACVQAFAPAKKIGDFGKKVEVEFEDGTRTKVPQSECRSVIYT